MLIIQGVSIKNVSGRHGDQITKGFDVNIECSVTIVWMTSEMKGLDERAIHRRGLLLDKIDVQKDLKETEERESICGREGEYEKEKEEST